MRLGGLTTLADSLEDLLSVFIELQLGDDNLAGVNTDRYALTVRLLSADSFNVNEVLQSVDGGDFSFSTLLRSTNHSYFVVLSDRNASNLQRSTTCITDPNDRHTLCFSRSSLERGALIITRLS